jgi:hypothetical protein
MDKENQSVQNAMQNLEIEREEVVKDMKIGTFKLINYLKIKENDRNAADKELRAFLLK